MTTNPAQSSFLEKYTPALVRVLVWGGVFSVLFILRSFFLLIFFTFVFGYIQNRGVNWLGRFMPNRPLRAVLVAIVFLSVLIAIGLFLVPRAKEQTVLFVIQIPEYMHRLDQELIELGSRYPLLQELIPEPEFEKNGHHWLGNSRISTLVQQIFGFSGLQDGQLKVNQILEIIRGVGGSLAAIASAFLLALLFSFLVVLDLPRLCASVRSLSDTKLDFVYREVSGSIQNFASVMGSALEAQFIIAILNATLTALGVALLGLGGRMAFLTTIVFLCSFIPVLGVFISSIPICLLALQTSGLTTMMLAIVMITMIHLIEGYILNPRIYGSYMRINPVIVLFILTIGAKLFHVWGLILGVPICTYIFGHVIRREPVVASAELTSPAEEQAGCASP